MSIQSVGCMQIECSIGDSENSSLMLFERECVRLQKKVILLKHQGRFPQSGAFLSKLINGLHLACSPIFEV